MTSNRIGASTPHYNRAGAYGNKGDFDRAIADLSAR
jgi:hypothetical protein